MSFNVFTKKLQSNSSTISSTSSANQTILKAGSNWVNGDFIGTGLLEDTDGQIFTGLDVSGGNYYVYTRINGVWSRMQKQ